jgi:hypothetical protein
MRINIRQTCPAELRIAGRERPVEDLATHSDPASVNRAPRERGEYVRQKIQPIHVLQLKSGRKMCAGQSVRDLYTAVMLKIHKDGQSLTWFWTIVLLLLLKEVCNRI